MNNNCILIAIASTSFACALRIKSITNIPLRKVVTAVITVTFSASMLSMYMQFRSLTDDKAELIINLAQARELVAASNVQKKKEALKSFLIGAAKIEANESDLLATEDYSFIVNGIRVYKIVTIKNDYLKLELEPESSNR